MDSRKASVNATKQRLGEWVIIKPGKGAFAQTGLDDMLRSHNITHLIFTGVITEVCVQSTMREANDQGDDCLLVEDAIESYFPEFKQATLNMLQAQGAIVGWKTTAEQGLRGLKYSISLVSLIRPNSVESRLLIEVLLKFAVSKNSFFRAIFDLPLNNLTKSS